MKKIMMVMMATVLMICNVAEAGEWTICKTPSGGTTFCRNAESPPAQAQLPPPVAMSPTQPPPSTGVTGIMINGNQQPGWCNNGKPQNPTESVICSSPELWAWDKAYNDAWTNTPQAARPDGKKALEDRNRYTNPAQIAAWYKSAIGQLTSGSPQVAQVAPSSGGDNNSGGVIPWCNKKLNEAERTLCQLAQKSPALATLEWQLNNAYTAYRNNNASRWRQENQKQRTWLEQRNTFLLSVNNANANPQLAATQLSELYQRRIAELQQP